MAEGFMSDDEDRLHIAETSGDDEDDSDDSSYYPVSKSGKRKRKKSVTQMPVKVARAIEAKHAFPIPNLEEGPHFIPGAKPAVGAGNGNRQSVAMKLQLRVIEANVSRIMQERDQIARVQKCILDAEKALMTEKKNLLEMDKYLDSTICQTMNNEEFAKFYNKYFVEANFEEEKGSSASMADEGPLPNTKDLELD